MRERIRKVSNCFQFRKVWISRLRTGYECVYSFRYILRRISLPSHIRHWVHVASGWTTVDKDRSCQQRKKISTVRIASQKVFSRTSLWPKAIAVLTTDWCASILWSTGLTEEYCITICDLLLLRVPSSCTLFSRPCLVDVLKKLFLGWNRVRSVASNPPKQLESGLLVLMMTIFCSQNYERFSTDVSKIIPNVSSLSNVSWNQFFK